MKKTLLQFLILVLIILNNCGIKSQSDLRLTHEEKVGFLNEVINDFIVSINSDSLINLYKIKLEILNNDCGLSKISYNKLKCNELLLKRKQPHKDIRGNMRYTIIINPSCDFENANVVFYIFRAKGGEAFVYSYLYDIYKKEITEKKFLYHMIE